MEVYEYGGVRWISHPLLTHGDYVGGTVERANIEEVLDSAREQDQEWQETWWSHVNRGGGEPFGEEVAFLLVYGDFSSRSVLLREDHPFTDEVLGALEGYPVLSEDRLSEVENEEVEEAIGSWVLQDLEGGIRKAAPSKVDAKVDALLDSAYIDLRHLLDRAMAEAGAEWHHETGGAFIYRFDETIEEATRLLLEDLAGVFENQDDPGEYEPDRVIGSCDRCGGHGPRFKVTRPVSWGITMVCPACFGHWYPYR